MTLLRLVRRRVCWSWETVWQVALIAAVLGSLWQATAETWSVR